MIDTNRTDMVLKVLSLEDSLMDFEIISEQLTKAGYHIDISRVETGKDFESSLRNNSFDIILADYNLPSFDAFRALAISNEICPDVPFICVSGSIGEILAIELLKQGAVDYVLKDRLERLPFAIKRALDEAVGKNARILAEEELKNKEVKYRTLTENIPDIITRFDKDLRHIYVNPAIERISGLPPEKFLGKTNGELGMPEEKIAVWNQNMSFVFETAEQRNFEFDFMTPDGLRYFSSLIVPEFTEEGKVTSIMSVARDITEQKLAEIALRNSEERLRDIIFSTADWVWEIDKNGRYTYSSIKGNELFETSQEDIIGKTPFAFMPPDEAERIGKIFNDLVAKRAPIRNLENWNIAKNGKRICLLTNGVPIVDKDGNFKGYRGVDINITERKNAEEVIRQSEAELNRAQEIAKMGSWVLNLETNKYTWSQNMYLILGYDILNKVVTFEDFTRNIHPDDKYLIDLHLNKMSETRNGADFDFRYLLPDGEIRWIQSISTPHFENDKLIELRGVTIDITEKKQSEQELLQAKEKAEASNRLKTAFMNNISHEIRTPLNGILGFAPLIAEPSVTSEQKEKYLKILNNSSNRLLQTITDYMDISLITSGNMEVREKEFILNELIDDIYDEFHSRCNEKHLVFSVKNPYKSETKIINTDKGLLTKIIAHLLDNAIKFTKSGAITLGISAENGLLRISVTDTGKGISEAALPDIFKHFIQEDSDNTRGYEGSGLGLSIVNGLVQLLGGNIWVESIKEVGSTFSLTIPGLKERRNPGFTEGASLQGLKPSDPTILIAEDDDSGFLVLEIMLNKFARVMRAENGQEAVEHCRANPGIDLVLMDIKMPVMNGLNATREIKKFRKTLPVIMLTAYAEVGMSEKCLEAGGDGYMTKPIKINELLAELAKYGLIRN